MVSLEKGVVALEREVLLREGVLSKFLRYVRFETTSAEGAGRTPSTSGQLTLAKQLELELKTMGLQDASVDENGFVTAALSGGVTGCPTVAFLAHLDTAPGVPGGGVRPLVLEPYTGGDIKLPKNGVVIRPETCRPLNRVKGHKLVTSDGSTLLGADDKAGIAEIMEALCRLIMDPVGVFGTVKVAFTPDEEIGKGMEKFPLRGFGAHVGYTLDGGGLGEIEDENFNALNFEVTVTGRSAHTGAARNAMVNALHLSAQLMGAIPANMRPETTDGILGFIHPDSVEGNVEQVMIKILVRDFTEEGLHSKKALLEGLCEDLMRRHPGSEARLRETGGYRNMKEVLQKTPKVVGLAVRAIQAAGIKPVRSRVRGGTDGARLTHMGLPTPNLFTGGANFHSRQEWVSVQWMEMAVDTVVRLCGLWSGEISLH